MKFHRASSIKFVVAFFLAVFSRANADISQLNGKKLIPRKIIALYDSRIEAAPDQTLTHRFLEMPLNHLGLIVSYHDLAQGVEKKLAETPEVRGVVVCLPRGSKINQPAQYVEWLEQFSKNGKYITILGDLGISYRSDSDESSLLLKRLFHIIGLEFAGDYLTFTPELIPVVNKDGEQFVQFEGGLSPTFLPFPALKSSDPKTSVLLSICRNEHGGCSAAIAIHPKGGYISPDMSFINDFIETSRSSDTWWYVDPFKFFQTAFATKDLPTPDITTEMGRRALYVLASGAGITQRSFRDFSSSNHTVAHALNSEIASRFLKIDFTIAPEMKEFQSALESTNSEKNDIKELISLPNVEAAAERVDESYPYGNIIQFKNEVTPSFLTHGRSRLDSQFPSSTWIEPIAWAQQKNNQIFYFPFAEELNFLTEKGAADYSFHLLTESFKRTDRKYRLKPAAIGFDFGAISSEARFRTLSRLLGLLREQEYYPKKLSDYMKAADGFFSATIERCGDDCWIVKNRNGISTIRFDEKPTMHLDIKNSKGVVGYRHIHNDLYISLDKTVPEVQIVLTNKSAPTASSLVQSSFDVSNVASSDSEIHFNGSGIGKESSLWRTGWPQGSKVTCLIDGEGQCEIENQSNPDLLTGLLKVNVTMPARQQYSITIKRESQS